jgi:hypothetical protein
MDESKAALWIPDTRRQCPGRVQTRAHPESLESGEHLQGMIKCHGRILVG